MKTKTKMIIALSLAGVITLGAVIALVVVIASFNATAGSGLSVSYVAKNVEAEVSMGYVVSDYDKDWPCMYDLTFTPINAGTKTKLSFSSDDTADTISKSFNNLENIELTKDNYLYLKYTFKHTGTESNSNKYLNVSLSNTFSSLNNIKIEYGFMDPLSENYMAFPYVTWAPGVNGITMTREGDNSADLYVRISVDMKTQNALLDGSFVFNMTSSDTEYYTHLSSTRYLTTGKYIFDYATAENLALVANADSTREVGGDGSGPITEYTVGSDKYILSEKEIYVFKGEDLFGDYGWETGERISEIVLNNFNTKYVTSMRRMFYAQNNLTSIDLSKLDTSNVTDMYGMFQRTGLQSIDFSLLDTSKVTNIGYIVAETPALSSGIDWSKLDTSNAIDMSGLFYGYSGTNAIDLSVLDTSNVTNMSGMFGSYRSSATLDLSMLNTSNVTNMSYMFSSYSSSATIDLSSLDTSKVTDMSGMFEFYFSTATLDISMLNTSNVTTMNGMFSTNSVDASNTIIWDFSNWNTLKVTDMSGMFGGATGTIDLSGLDTQNVTTMDQMFANSSLTTIYVDSNWTTENVTSSYAMFAECEELTGGNGTTFNSSYTDATYARIDTAETPGYFTLKTS